jgi:hypothetical protein
MLPALLGSRADRWREVAQSDVAFARGLAAEGIRFDASFRSRLIDGRVARCSPRPSKIRGLDSADLQRMDLYCLQFCDPWNRTWMEILSACDRLWVPKWCRSGDDRLVTEHVQLGSYFETLSAAIRESHDPLERSNIMEVIAERLNDEVLRHHPSDPLDEWVSGALSAYLQGATPDEVILIAEPICGATFGHGARVAREFVAFRDRPGAMTENQKCAMKAILSRKDRWSCAGYSGGSVKKTEDEKTAERHALEASVLTPRNIGLLMRRIDAYYLLKRDEDCSRSYEFLALDLREGGYDKEGWVRTCKTVTGGSQILSWQVNRARGMGNKVKVYTLVRYQYRTGSQKGQTWSREWEDYWVFEDDTWNYALGILPSGWNDNQTSDVQIPHGLIEDDLKQDDKAEP